MASYRFEEFRNIADYSELPSGVVDKLRICIASAFGGTITEEDASNHISGDQLLVLSKVDVDEVPSILAFSSTSMVSPREQFLDDSFTDLVGCYFAGAAIAREFQSNGFYHELNKRRVLFAIQQQASFIFTRTQNPRVHESISKALEVMSSERLIGLAGMTRVIKEGVYGRMLTAEKPVAREVNYDDLDQENGDAAIITWTVGQPLRQPVPQLNS